MGWGWNEEELKTLGGGILYFSRYEGKKRAKQQAEKQRPEKINNKNKNLKKKIINK